MDIRTTKSGNYKATLTNPSWLSNLLNDREPDRVSTTYSAYNFVPLMFRATRLRANTISSVPVDIIRIGSEEVTEWPFETPARTFIWQIEAALCLAGAAYFTPVKKGAQVIDYEYLNPLDMSVKTDKTEKDGVVLTFKQGTTGDEWINIPSRNYYELLYIPEFNVQNKYLPGASMASVAIGDAQLIQYLQRFASKFFEGGAMPVTLLAMENVGNDEITRVENWFERAGTGIKNAFRVLGVRAGMIQPTVLTQPVKDMVIPELHEQARRNVALAFEIPHTALEDAANYATAVVHNEQFYTGTVEPRIFKIWDHIDRQVLNKLGLSGNQDIYKLSLFQKSELERAQAAQIYYTMTTDNIFAFSLAGVELTDDQLAMLEEKAAEKEQAAEDMQEQMQPKEDDQPDEQPTDEDQEDEDMKRWKRKAIKAVKAGKPADVQFESEYIDPLRVEAIKAQLADATTIEDVVKAFESVPSGEIADQLAKLIGVLSND